MNEVTACSIVDAPRSVEQYVSGRMSKPERDAFEDHFVTCAQCQREIQLVGAVRTALLTPSVVADRASTWRRGPSRGWIGAGVALAAGIAAITIVRMAPSPALTKLGDVVEPPIYLGVAVRGTVGRADSIFDQAMYLYASQRYGDAATGLRAALAAGQDSVPTEFFLGVSELLSGDARRAAATLSHVVAKGDTPYLVEAQLYEAKALLRLGRGQDALVVLAQTKPTDPVFAATFVAFADSITRTIAR